MAAAEVAEIGDMPLKIKRFHEKMVAEGMADGKEVKILTLTFAKHEEVGYFGARAGARGQLRASRNDKALVFPGMRRGRRPSASYCGNPFGFANECGIPGRGFRESRRRPRALSKLSC
jgi:hypothetical protein